jgi:hypothetical protein
MMDMKCGHLGTEPQRNFRSEYTRKVYLHVPAISTAEFALQSLSPHKHTNCHTYHFKIHKILVCSEPAKHLILYNPSHVTNTKTQYLSLSHVRDTHTHARTHARTHTHTLSLSHTQVVFTVFKITATSGEILFYQQCSYRCY